MRILQLHNHHAALGGAMEVLAHEARLLAAAGHEVEEFTLPAAEDLGLSAVRAGAKAVWNVQASREAARRIRSYRPDVVHDDRVPGGQCPAAGRGGLPDQVGHVGGRDVGTQVGVHRLLLSSTRRPGNCSIMRISLSRRMRSASVRKLARTFILCSEEKEDGFAKAVSCSADRHAEAAERQASAASHAETEK